MLTSQDASLISATFNAIETQAGIDATILWHANFTNADLRNSQFEKAQLRDANMSHANLNGATLKGANLRRTVVTAAQFPSVDLSDALYAPVSQPPENNYAGLVGLHTVTFPEGEQTGLVQLRDQLRRAGLRALEREATFAIERNKVLHELQSGSMIEKIGAVAQMVFFGWTVGWGLHPGRALLILIGIIVATGPFYCLSIVTKVNGKRKKSGVFRIWQRERLEITQTGVGIREDTHVERLSASMPKALLYCGGVISPSCRRSILVGAI